MSISTNSFECPIANNSMTYLSEILSSLDGGLTPITNFKDCDGLPFCDVRKEHRDGYIFSWGSCPLYCSMQGD